MQATTLQRFASRDYAGVEMLIFTGFVFPKREHL